MTLNRKLHRHCMSAYAQEKQAENAFFASGSGISLVEIPERRVDREGGAFACFPTCALYRISFLEQWFQRCRSGGHHFVADSPHLFRMPLRAPEIRTPSRIELSVRLHPVGIERNVWVRSRR